MCIFLTFTYRTFDICPMTQENLSTGFVAKKGYFQIKAVERTENNG